MNKITPTTVQKFFLYARKSTDVEDKQVLSIEAQLAELRAFAKREDLHVIEEFIEKQSAKIPGRPIFDEMLDRAKKGEANGILAWHPLCKLHLSTYPHSIVEPQQTHYRHMRRFCLCNRRRLLRNSRRRSYVVVAGYFFTFLSVVNTRFATCRFRQRMAQSLVLPSLSFFS